MAHLAKLKLVGMDWKFLSQESETECYLSPRGMARQGLTNPLRNDNDMKAIKAVTIDTKLAVKLCEEVAKEKKIRRKEGREIEELSDSESESELGSGSESEPESASASTSDKDRGTNVLDEIACRHDVDMEMSEREIKSIMNNVKRYYNNPLNQREPRGRLVTAETFILKPKSSTRILFPGPPVSTNRKSRGTPRQGTWCRPPGKSVITNDASSHIKFQTKTNARVNSTTKATGKNSDDEHKHETAEELLDRVTADVLQQRKHRSTVAAGKFIGAAMAGARRKSQQAQSSFEKGGKDKRNNSIMAQIGLLNRMSQDNKTTKKRNTPELPTAYKLFANFCKTDAYRLPVFVRKAIDRDRKAQGQTEQQPMDKPPPTAVVVAPSAPQSPSLSHFKGANHGSLIKDDIRSASPVQMSHTNAVATNTPQTSRVSMVRFA